MVTASLSIQDVDPENSGTYIETKMICVPRDLGPWGASDGKHWDDGVFSSIKKVQVSYAAGSCGILAVRFKYEKVDGKCFRSPWHGDDDRPDLRDVYASITFGLDSPNEFIVGIEGFYGPQMDCEHGYEEALTSITFYSNKCKYGPYGKMIGKYFSSMYSDGRVVGFFGRSGTYLNAIGVHVEYF